MVTVTEMEKLMGLLDAANVPYEVRYPYGLPQVCYPHAGKGMVCDAVCHFGSYGYREGLLEIMGLTQSEEDNVEGFMTAEQVATRIIGHYRIS